MRDEYGDGRVWSLLGFLSQEEERGEAHQVGGKWAPPADLSCAGTAQALSALGSAPS